METRNIDYIESVKEQWDNIQDKIVVGYIVNGNMSVPTTEGNSHYKDVLEWLKDDEATPQFTEEEIEDKIKIKNINSVKNTASKDLSTLTSDYPSFEVDSFWIQEIEARAYKADDTTETPFIDNLADARGIDKDTLVDKIIEKSDSLKIETAKIIGKYQKDINEL